MTHWPNEIELELTGIAQGGDAVGHVDGRAVFASGGLPGEHVRVRLHDRQRNFARGAVIALLRAAPERITSPCPLEHVCGAADWRWIEPNAQLRWKQTILRDQLTHLGGLELGDLEIGATNDPQHLWGYRTTVELHAANGRLGYFAPNSREVHDIPACCLHHPAINAALAALRPLLRASLPLAGVTLRCSPSSGEVLAKLEFHVGAGKRQPARQEPIDLAAWTRLARKWQSQFAPLVGVVAALPGKTEVLVGQPWLQYALAGVQFRLSASAFFQVNGFVTPLLVERVQHLLAPQPHEHVLDLFCGVGTFALPLARHAAHVIGVESYAPAIVDARSNAERNHLSNVVWHTGPVEQVLPRLDVQADAVVLDPPRRGCEPAALAALAALQPERIVYVACHPGTLARDCRQLVAQGYRLTHAEVIDLFPQTHHVESIVRLERKKTR